MTTMLKSESIKFLILFLCTSCLANADDIACQKIHTGEVSYHLLPNNDPKLNAQYFHCALEVKITEDDTIPGKKPTKKIDITKFADHFLHKIDPSYKDEYGSNLLSIVIISFTSEDWKLETAKNLIAQGVDVKSKNIFNKTALDLAIFNHNKEIAKLIELQTAN